MSEIDAPLKYAEAAEDRTGQDGNIGMLVLLALGLAFAALALAMLTRDAAEPFVLAVLGGLAMIGVFCLFAGAVGMLNFGEQAARNDTTKAFADNLDHGTLITDARGSVIYANAAYFELAAGGGGTVEARQVPNIERAFAGEAQWAEPIFRLLRAAREGRDWQEEAPVTYRTAAGDGPAGKRWLKISVRQIASGPKAKNQALLHVWRVEDISSARAREQDAFERLQQMVDYLDRAPAGFLSVDGEGGIDYLNTTLAQWLDIDLAKAAAGEFQLADLMSKETAELVARAGARSGAGDEQSFEVDFKRHDGTQLPVRLIHRAAPGGEVEGAVSHMLVLKRTTAGAGDLRYARFFQSAPIGIASVDGDGRIGSSNTAFAHMFDYGEGRVDGEEARDRTAIARLIGEEGRAALGTAIAAAKSGQAAIEPVDATFGEGNARNGRFYVSPAGGGSQSGEAAIVYAIDTTELRLLEMQIAQSQKMQAVGQLAGGIAHDFNNVLTAIIGFSELLLANHRPSDPAFQDIMNIRQNANRAAALVRQLLAFSRRQTLQPETLALGDVLSELTILLGRLLGEQIDLNVVHGRDLWKVKADLHQFEQVIVNLAVNARDAMPEGGKLTIHTANVSERDAAGLGLKGMVPEDFVLCEVSDTGIGIAPHVLEKIFEPFFSTKEVGKGTGLGLSTVYGIIKQTGGYIYPESEPGNGTTFRIYLPRHVETQEEFDAAQPETGADTKKQDLTGTGTVLLVEDEEAVRNFAMRALTSRGYEVLEAGSGVEALDVLEAFDGQVDLVVSDVVMPEMDGPTLLGKLRERDSNIKVIFISGYAEDAFKKNLGEGKDFVMLPKPFSLKQLAATVKKTLES